MDWLSFLLSVIEVIAWPVALVATVVFLREEWVDVNGRIQRAKHKNAESEFGDRLQKVGEKASSVLPDSVDLESKALIHRLELAGYSPRGAILESWIEIEAALEELGARHGIPAGEIQNSDLSMLQLRLEGHNTLAKGALGLLQSLRETRNEAFHLTNTVIGSDAAKEYVSLASRMATLLKEP